MLSPSDLFDLIQSFIFDMADALIEHKGVAAIVAVSCILVVVGVIFALQFWGPM